MKRACLENISNGEQADSEEEEEVARLPTDY